MVGSYVQERSKWGSVKEMSTVKQPKQSPTACALTAATLAGRLPSREERGRKGKEKRLSKYGLCLKLKRALRASLREMWLRLGLQGGKCLPLRRGSVAGVQVPCAVEVRSVCGLTGVLRTALSQVFASEFNLFYINSSQHSITQIVNCFLVKGSFRITCSNCKSLQAMTTLS